MKILFITVAVVMFLFIWFALMCAMIIAGRYDEQTKGEETGEMLVEKQICPECKTGKESYGADRKSEICPYIGNLKNGNCRFYRPLDRSVKTEGKQKDK